MSAFSILICGTSSERYRVGESRQQKQLFTIIIYNNSILVCMIATGKPHNKELQWYICVHYKDWESRTADSRRYSVSSHYNGLCICTSICLNLSPVTWPPPLITIHGSSHYYNWCFSPITAVPGDGWGKGSDGWRKKFLFMVVKLIVFKATGAMHCCTHNANKYQLSWHK